MNADAMQRIRAIGLLVLVAIMAVYTFVFFTEDENGTASTFGLMGVVLVVGALNWMFAVLPAVRRPEGNTPAKVGLILGIISIPSIMVWWASLPLVLGAGAVGLGMEGAQRAKKGAGRGGLAVTAMVLGAIALIVYVFAVATG